MNKVNKEKCVFLGKTLQSTGYVKWDPIGGEPNNYGGNEDCGSMTKQGTLNDIGCEYPTVFFCEIASIYPRTNLGKVTTDGNGNDNDEDNGLNHVEDNTPESTTPKEENADINQRSLRNNTIIN